MQIHSDRRRACLIAAFVICLFALRADQAVALIVGGQGNEPVDDAGWPAGAMEVANLKSRVGWWEGPPFGGGMHVFLYREETGAKLNEALALFAKINANRLDIVIHDGPEESFWLRDHTKPPAEKQPLARVDWTFTVWRPESWHRLYNDPRSTFASDQEQFRQPVDPPRVDLYIGGGKIAWEDVELPDGGTVRDERQSASPIALAEGSTVRGRVRDMLTHKPIAGAKLSVVKAVARSEGGYDWQSVAQGTTDDNGSYELANAEPDANAIYLRAAGYALRQVDLPSSQHPVYRNVDIELAPAEAFSGRVIDEDGRPVPGVVVSPTVALGIDGRGYKSAAEREATTDGDGFFVLTNLPRGFVQLSYRKPGMYHTPLGELLSVPGEAIAVTMVRTGVIRGQVTSAAGPVADTAVMLDQEQPQKPGVFGGKGTWGGGTNTDAQGRFEFSGAPPGNYRLRSNNQTKTITLGGGEAIDVEIKLENK